MIEAERLKIVSDGMRKLPKRDRTVLKKWYGLTKAEPVSFAVIGEELGVTASRAQQMKDEALAKLVATIQHQHAKAYRLPSHDHPGRLAASSIRSTSA